MFFCNVIIRNFFFLILISLFFFNIVTNYNIIPYHNISDEDFQSCIKFEKLITVESTIGYMPLNSLGITVRHFTKFKQVKLDCISDGYSAINQIALIPSQMLLLDNTLNFNLKTLNTDSIILKFAFIKNVIYKSLFYLVQLLLNLILFV